LNVGLGPKGLIPCKGKKYKNQTASSRLTQNEFTT